MPPNVLCAVCRVEEHEELIEPVITSCGHLFCWPCLYSWVKTAARDYPCPMCRLLVSAVTSDLSRGKYRDEEEVLQSRIPRRPGQGVFPFDFELAASGQEMNSDEDVQLDTSGVQQQQPTVIPDQPLRRSLRSRRRNLRYRGFVGDYIDSSSGDDENVEERHALSIETTEVATRDSTADIERIDLESVVGEETEIETNSDNELPEVERRFIQRESENMDRLTEQVTAGPVNISIESVNSTEQQFREWGDSEDHPEEPSGGDEFTDVDHMGLQADGDVVVNALPDDDHHEEAIVERRYFSSKTVIEGTQLTHLEATVLYALEEIREKNVKIASLNYCEVARALKRDHDLCFPGKSIKDMSKLIKNIITKAKRDFETNKSILPSSLRAGDQRETRMEETMGAILRIDSAAPEAVRQTARRGISARRPPIDGRPAIPGPEVGRIAEQVSDDGQDNYLEQRRRNQEQGAELREASLGQMRNTRVNNNARLSTQMNNFSTALATLSQTRQQSSSTVGNLLPELIARRDERARSRSRERAERRTMDLLLVSTITKKEELASSVNVGRNLTVFKKADPFMNSSPDFPITLKLINIDKLTSDLSEYLEVQSVVNGIVLKRINHFQSIITSCDIIDFSEAYAEVLVKRDKTYVLLTEKPSD